MQLVPAADAAMAPPYGYSEHVLLPVLRQHLGLQLDMQCLRHGAFPKARPRHAHHAAADCMSIHLAIALPAHGTALEPASSHHS